LFYNPLDFQTAQNYYFTAQNCNLLRNCISQFRTRVLNSPQDRPFRVIQRLLSTEMMDLVQRSLDSAALSHKVIADNISNVDTPGFKRSEVMFSEKLRQAFEARAQEPQHLAASRTQPGHLEFEPVPDVDSITPEISTDQSTSLRNDGNNVDIDREISLLAQNTVWYNTLAQITQQQFAGLRSAIREGK
jgi:flagellar basal-body rod protein FlgB